MSDHEQDWKRALAGISKDLRRQTAPPPGTSRRIRSSLPAQRTSARPDATAAAAGPAAAAKSPSPPAPALIPASPARSASSRPAPASPAPARPESPPSGKPPLRDYGRGLSVYATTRKATAPAPVPRTAEPITDPLAPSSLAIVPRRLPRQPDTALWRTGGRLLQLDAGPRAARQRMTIGLDFGTAFTKVVVADGANRRYVVNFEAAVRARGAAACFLPGFLAIDSGGLGWLGCDRNNRLLADLKFRLLEETLDAQTRAAIVCYLALVLRYTRHWLLTQHRSVYANRRLEWFVNVGVPAARWRQAGIDDEYRRLVEAAWKLSVAEDEPTLAAAQSVQQERPCLLGERLATVPEFIAQIAMYVNSPQRRPDLHLLVDVGAGTLDVSTFNVHESDGEHVFPIFASRVERLGCHYAIRRALAGTSARVIEDAGFDRQKLAGIKGVTETELQQRLRTVENDVCRVISAVLTQTKGRRYRNSRAWSDGLPVLLCGGGREVALYRSAIERLIADRYPLRLLHLNRPSNLVAPELPETALQRLSVAYGLSFAFENLGLIRTADTVEDDLPSADAAHTYRDRYIEK